MADEERDTIANPHNTYVRGRVSVITATFNAAKTLSTCLESVASQSYRDIEHIVIDGGSQDATLDILRRADGFRMRWSSEPDRGIYDAWNKGIAAATGEWIAFLGADDRYCDGAVQAYMEAVDGRNIDYLCGLVRWIPANETPKIIGAPWSWPAFQCEMRQAHVGSLHHRQLFELYGEYDLSYKIVGDYEFLLRARHNLTALFVPVITAEMDAGGVSDSFRALKEAERAKVESGGRPRAQARLEFWIKGAKLMVRRALVRLRSRSR